MEKSKRKIPPITAKRAIAAMVVSFKEMLEARNPKYCIALCVDSQFQQKVWDLIDKRSKELVRRQEGKPSSQAPKKSSRRDTGS